MKESLQNRIDKLHSLIQAAECVIVGGGSGLSSAAGLTYSGERFTANFGDFIKRYDLTDMYSAAFYPFKTQEEKWAYWSRHILLNRWQPPALPLYQTLFELVGDKDYFVITTNVDHCFQKAGFDKKRLFYTQGDYGLFQCSEPCCQETFDNEAAIREMVKRQQNMKVPTELLPVCPHCGKPMTMNLRCDDTFVEDEGWHKAAERYENFLRTRSEQKILFLELGVGYNTPTIVKYSFWRMAHDWKDATYACLNYGEAYAPDEIRKKSICINGDIGEILSQI